MESIRTRQHLGWSGLLAIVQVAIVLATGCTGFMAPRDPYPANPADPPATSSVPRELEMVSLPPYVIEPPDILMINAVKIVPKPPHKIEPFDGLLIRVLGALPDQPIADAFSVDPEGNVDLGPTYGSVKVVDLTIDEAQDAIRKHLSQSLEEPEVSVSLAFSSGAQQIVGEHLVAMDGRVNLGTYGSVYVAGMTIEEATAAIEAATVRLSRRPGSGRRRLRLQQQGVLHHHAGRRLRRQRARGSRSPATKPCSTRWPRSAAVAASLRTKMWIARPAPNGVGCEQILPVNWDDITRGASTATNYQLMPGDRLFIAEDPMTRFDAVISKFTAPFERMFGFVSLGTAMANRITRFGLQTF